MKELKKPEDSINLKDFFERINKKLVNGANHNEIKMLMSKYNISPTCKNNSPICYAAENGYDKLASFLLLNYSKVNPATWDRNHSDYPLRVACQNGHSKIVAILLKDKRVNPAVNNSVCLRIACKYGHTDIVNLLLKHPKKQIKAEDISELINSLKGIYKLNETQKQEKIKEFLIEYLENIQINNKLTESTIELSKIFKGASKHENSEKQVKLVKENIDKYIKEYIKKNQKPNKLLKLNDLIKNFNKIPNVKNNNKTPNKFNNKINLNFTINKINLVPELASSILKEFELFEKNILNDKKTCINNIKFIHNLRDIIDNLEHNISFVTKNFREKKSGGNKKIKIDITPPYKKLIQNYDNIKTYESILRKSQEICNEIKNHIKKIDKNININSENCEALIVAIRNSRVDTLNRLLQEKNLKINARDDLALRLPSFTTDNSYKKAIGYAVNSIKNLKEKIFDKISTIIKEYENISSKNIDDNFVKDLFLHINLIKLNEKIKLDKATKIKGFNKIIEVLKSNFKRYGSLINCQKNKPNEFKIKTFDKIIDNIKNRKSKSDAFDKVCKVILHNPNTIFEIIFKEYEKRGIIKDTTNHKDKYMTYKMIALKLGIWGGNIQKQEVKTGFKLKKV